ncbi:MAG TPA: MFS transporter [Vicinamibacteria bacterium]|nr:MFS transporter [Vicinamibacteria bacterium]
MRLRTLPIFFAFFVMGFVDAVGTLVGFAKDQYHLSGFMAGLLPFFGFIAFALFSVPGGVLMDKKGKKLLMVLSLAIVLVGEALPAMTTGYVLLVAAIFLIGIGMALLQVAGNPIMRDVSEEGLFARNLTFAQFVKGLGSIAGPAVAIALVSRGLPWNSIFSVFGVVVAATLAGVAFLKVEEKKGEDKPPASIASSFALLGHPHVFMMILGLFLYVGAEVGVNSWIATFLNQKFQFDLGSLATGGIAFFFLALSIGRLIGSAVLNFMSARQFLLVTAGLSVLGTLGIMLGTKEVAVGSIFLTGLGFGNVSPLVFSILIDRMPERSAELSGLLCMAIAGGAIMPPIMGKLSDIFGSATAAMAVPFLSCLYILFLGVRAAREAKA